MRYIQKQAEPKAFLDWKVTYEEFGGTPFYQDLRSNLKNILKQSLIDEQGKICCYCGCRIHLNNTHIEHLKPQSKYPDEQVVYTNLVASCEGENRLVHCGHNKENWYDEELFVSPLDLDCELYFTFTYDGRILPCAHDAQKEKMARTTIEKLGLDTKKLNALRLAAIDAILYLEDLSVSEINDFIQSCQTPDENGALLPFAPALQYVLNLERDRMRGTAGEE